MALWSSEKPHKMIPNILAIAINCVCQMVFFGASVAAFTSSTTSSSPSYARPVINSQRRLILATCHRLQNHQQNNFASQLFASTDSTDNNAQANADDENAKHEQAMLKALKAMTSFSNKYIENTQTYYCSDLSIPAVVIKGLAEHKVKLGAPLCPCRFYEDKEKEAKDGYWNW